MSSFDSLPSELLREIVECDDLSLPDLSALSKTSRSLRDEGQRVLFRNPGHIGVGLSLPTPDPNDRLYHERETGLGKGAERLQGKAFFDVILSSPHRLAPLVHTYAQTTFWFDYSSLQHWGEELPAEEIAHYAEQALMQEQLFATMAQAFKVMLNLKSLWSFDGAESWVYSPGPMMDCLCESMFSLKQLSWHHYGGDRQLIEQFLPNQQRLRYLQLPHGLSLNSNQETERILSAGRTARLALDSISGPFSTSVVILSGKTQIKYLCWTPPISELLFLHDVEKWLQPMSRQLRQIQYLEYQDFDCGPLLEEVAPHLQELVFLKMCIEYIGQVSILLNNNSS
jgi:hypothetical protein